MTIATFDTLLQPNSVNISHIDFSTDDISGDYISGGTITNFSSTGIIDEATSPKVHIDNDGLSVDNLISTDIEVDNITVSGKMTVKNMTIEYQHEEIVSNINLHKPGLIYIGKDCVMSRSELGSSVVYSNLRKVGRLTNLIVDGRFDAGYTLTVNDMKNQVGINTEEPIGALHVVNDGGAEVVIDGSGAEGYIGTVRNQSLILGADSLRQNKPALLTISPYGPIHISHTLDVRGDITFNGTKFTTGYETPSPGWHKRAEIIWNQEPSVGRPIGWVCTEAGEPGTWAAFGTIE